MTERVLEGRSAIITGANQGLGLAIALAFVRAGASVVMCARNDAALETARAEVAVTARVSQTVLAIRADVSSSADVERLVAESLSVFPSLDILVNNAGVYGPIGAIEQVDWNEWVEAIHINLLGSVLMCRALLPHMKRRSYGKIVQLSGGGAAKPLPRFSAYAASKAAIVRFVETLAEEVSGDRIDVNAIAPGALNTRMLDQVIEAGPERAGTAFYQNARAQLTNGGAPLTTAAELALFLASPASDGISGRLLAALWDPWETLAQHRDDLKGSDIYTLRRIIPKDRGHGWGDR